MADPLKSALIKAVDDTKASFARVLDLKEIRFHLKGREQFIPIREAVVTERALPRGTDICFFLYKSADFEKVLKTFDMELGWKFVPGGSGEPYRYVYSEDTTILLSQ
ncbi:MAG: hypothetical protein AAB613_01040 [Patescibacteria group bacterium]